MYGWSSSMVFMCIANCSLKAVATDIVLSVNVPLKQDEPLPLPSSSVTLFEPSTNDGVRAFQQVLKTFEIHDWALFG